MADFNITDKQGSIFWSAMVANDKLKPMLDLLWNDTNIPPHGQHAGSERIPAFLRALADAVEARMAEMKKRA